MSKFVDLVNEENSLRLRASLDKLEEGEYVKFLRKLREAGEYIGDPDERDWLAAAARRWSYFLYDKTGVLTDAKLRSYVEGRPFDPTLFVGREQELKELIDWATARKLHYRLKTIAAPPGYGKSWLLSELERRLSSRDGVFIIRVPTLRLKSDAGIAAWLPSIVKAAREICPEVHYNESDTLAELIAHLLEDLCVNCNRDLRPLLIVDSFDELPDDERWILEDHLLEPFWRNKCTHIVIAFNDALSLTNPNVRRGEDRMPLDVFIPQVGEEQLQKRVKKDKVTNFSAIELMPLIPPYNWTHPAINSYLYQVVIQKIRENRTPSFSADDLRNSWLSLIEDKLDQVELTLNTIESDLKTMAGHVEDTWTIRIFGQMCGCSELEASRRVQELMALSLVSFESGRHKIVDGIREILKVEPGVELRLREIRSSQIGQLLNGLSPFTGHNAEAEIDFLFGEEGGFWSEHPVYEEIFWSPKSQLILGENGSGKTAMAQALVRLGSPEGILPKDIIPIYLDKIAPISDIQMAVNQEIGLSIDANHLVDEKHWLKMVQESLVGMDKTVLLSLDPHDATEREVQQILDKFKLWEPNGLRIKLFLDSGIFKSAPSNAPELVWTDKQLEDMIRWRFDILARLADIRGIPDILFDEKVFPQFIRGARRNPRRLAELWDYLFDDHLKHSPDQGTFSESNLKRAMERLS